jgi:hypothetical protein
VYEAKVYETPTPINTPRKIQHPRLTLLGLPGELQNKIYEYIFDCVATEKKPFQPLLVCRQMFHECHQITFKDITWKASGLVGLKRRLWRVDPGFHAHLKKLKIIGSGIYPLTLIEIQQQYKISVEYLELDVGDIYKYRYRPSKAHRHKAHSKRG